MPDGMISTTEASQRLATTTHLLAAAHQETLHATRGLSGEQLSRAAVLAELIVDAVGFSRRLSFVVDGRSHEHGEAGR